jgi:tetratricopeptide (TPR) repeat protein
MKIVILSIFLLLISFSFAQESISHAKIDTSWWYPVYSSGMNFLEQNDFQSAEIEFNKILEKDDEVAYGHYALGLVYDKSENGGTKAEEYLLEAIDLDPDFVEAYYYLGFYYEKMTREDITHGQDSRRKFEAVTQIDPHFIYGWLQWARVTERFFWPPHSKPAEILAQGLKINPQSRNLYLAFIRSIFWHSEEDQGIPILRFMIKTYPSDPVYPTDLAKIFYRLERYPECSSMIDSIENNYSGYSKTRINLLRTKIDFMSDKIDKGMDHYWKAIENIQDSLDVKEIYADVRYIMTDIEYHTFIETPVKDIESFFKRFWLSRDPNLATPENERIPVHFKRLKYARKYYRRYLTTQNENELLYKFEHPLNGLVPVQQGDALTRSLITEALEQDLDIDDRGLIYIRHGEPDRWADFACITCPQNVSWQYFSHQNQPEMVFHFRKHADARGWFLESLPYAFSNRGDFGGVYALLDPTFEQAIDLPDRQWRYERLNQQNVALANIGLNTESDDYDYDKNLVNFPLKLISFKSSDSKTDIDLFFWVSGSVLQLDVSQSEHVLAYRKFISLFDEQWNETVRLNKSRKVPFLVSQEVWNESGFIELEKLSVPPGTYHCEIQLEDNVSNKLGVYKGTITIPDYSKEELMLSDVILSGPVSRTERVSYFMKGDIAYDPHMFSAFNKQETVGIYLEVYNLLFDTSDRTSFEVSWHLQSSDEDEREGKLVQSSLEYSGSSRDDRIYFNLELSGIDLGDYEVVVKVKDLISGAESRKITKITVR